jgi:phosphatidylserine/phosphatidylglycerophosphate/cardiolipin synthase-like enzyme
VTAAPRLLSAAIFLSAPGLGLCLAQDRIIFLDGSSRDGRVLAENNGVYTFQPAGAASTTPLAKDRIRFVVYGEAETREHTMGLVGLREQCADRGPRPVRILTAEAFADRVLDAIRSATKSVYLTTYSLREGRSGVHAEIFNALEERARDGVRVYLLVPAGPRAGAGVRIRAINYAERLARSGIRARFLTGRKIQHRKVAIIDERRAFVGSSNLSRAGLTGNIEMNIETEAPEFCREALADLRSLLRRAKPPHEVTF